MTQYDEDHDDPRQRCKHGTFIGSWWGPDYLCGQCESGDPDPTPSSLKEEADAYAKTFGEAYTLITAKLRLTFPKELTEAFVTRHKALWYRYEYALSSADGPEDTDWLRKAHAAEIAHYREEQRVARERLRAQQTN